jgi:maltose alpha-D-glucosyltransferase/alpha-amylase
MLFLHNLADRPCRVKVGWPHEEPGRPLSVAADGEYGDLPDLDAIDLDGYGYRWIRLHRYP